MKLMSYGLLLICLTAVHTWAQIQVASDDLTTSQDKTTYRFDVHASDMANVKQVRNNALEFKNVQTQQVKGVYYVAVSEGVSEATIVYRFDFDKVPYRPVAVRFRDHLTIFPTGQTKGQYRMVSQWSTDGKNYRPLHQVASDPKQLADCAERLPEDYQPIKQQTQSVWYRVRFVPQQSDAELPVGAMQWNRTGTAAPTFAADFVLTPDRTTRGDGMMLQLLPRDELPHIYQDKAYPDFVKDMSTDRYWRFAGATHGHTGSVKSVEAPQRPGNMALLCHARLDDTNPQAPVWVSWDRNLQPTWNIEKAEEVVFDIYPLTRIDFPLFVELGRRRGFGISPATWKTVGELEPNQWHEIRLPINKTRYDVDAFRLVINTTRHSVPQREDIRFVIDNLRLEPAPESLTHIFTDRLQAASPIEAGYLQQISPMQIRDDQPLQIRLEMAAKTTVAGILEVTGSNPQTGQSRTWKMPIELDNLNTAANLTIDHPAKSLRFGTHEFKLRLVNSDGRVLLQSQLPIRHDAFDSETMQQRRKALFDRLQQLRQRADALEQRGIVVSEPRVTLTAANMYLTDGGWVEQDFYKQNVMSIALQMLNDLDQMLDEAEQGLTVRADGKMVEPKLDDYRPGQPVEIVDGCIMQRGKPILLIGPIASPQYFKIFETFDSFPELGFNSVPIQTRLNDWIVGDNEQRLDADFLEKKFFHYAQKQGLSTHILLSSHYVPNPLPEEFKDAVSPYAGGSMLPLDIASEDTEALMNEWYERVLPLLEKMPNLVSIGTANEPGYTVHPGSKNFEKAFRQWAENRYANIDAANQRWNSDYETFDAIGLVDYFKQRTQHPGAEYDWQLFLDERLTDFFKKRKEHVLKHLPDVLVWVKLMGHDVHFGFPHMNEHSNVLRGQTVLGTDGHSPMWLDYLKSINPDWPIFNTEWHFMEKIDPRDRAIIAQRMFEGVVHGTACGLIWNWKRTDWDTRTLGANESLTRWAKSVDVVGRTSLRMRELAGPLSDLGKVDGGKVRLLYSLAENTHQGKNYVKVLREQYRALGMNATGHRFVFSHNLKPGDIDGVTLLAGANLHYIEADAANVIAQWVREGGTLWLSKPARFRNPWGEPLDQTDDAFLALCSQPGNHSFGQGRIVVGQQPQLVEYVEGPWAVDAQGQHLPQINIRISQATHGNPCYVSVINDSDETVRFKLHDQTGPWTANGPTRDIWNHQDVDLSKELVLPRRAIMLIKYR